jgi:hypothetical protein
MEFKRVRIINEKGYILKPIRVWVIVCKTVLKLKKHELG